MAAFAEVHSLEPRSSPLRLAAPADHQVVLGLIRDYYAYDEIPSHEQEIAPGLRTLLADPTLGRVFLILSEDGVAGYLIPTFSLILNTAAARRR